MAKIKQFKCSIPSCRTYIPFDIGKLNKGLTLHCPKCQTVWKGRSAGASCCRVRVEFTGTKVDKSTVKTVQSFGKR